MDNTGQIPQEQSDGRYFCQACNGNVFPFCPGSGLQQKCVSVSILVSDVNITNWAYLITHEGQTLTVLEQSWIPEWQGAERVHHNPALFHHQLGYHQLVAWCNLGINVYGHRYEGYSRLNVSNINPVQHPEQQSFTLGKYIDDNNEDSSFSSCDNIHSWISLSGDLAFSHQDGIYGSKFPKRFLEISSRDLTLLSILII
jgi:hypothetical protein